MPVNHPTSEILSLRHIRGTSGTRKGNKNIMNDQKPSKSKSPNMPRRSPESTRMSIIGYDTGPKYVAQYCQNGRKIKPNQNFETKKSPSTATGNNNQQYNFSSASIIVEGHHKNAAPVSDYHKKQKKKSSKHGANSNSSWTSDDVMEMSRVHVRYRQYQAFLNNEKLTVTAESANGKLTEVQDTAGWAQSLATDRRRSRSNSNPRSRELLDLIDARPKKSKKDQINTIHTQQQVIESKPQQQQKKNQYDSIYNGNKDDVIVNARIQKSDATDTYRSSVSAPQCESVVDSESKTIISDSMGITRDTRETGITTAGKFNDNPTITGEGDHNQCQITCSPSLLTPIEDTSVTVNRSSTSTVNQNLSLKLVDNSVSAVNKNSQTTIKIPDTVSENDDDDIDIISSAPATYNNANSDSKSFGSSPIRSPVHRALEKARMVVEKTQKTNSKKLKSAQQIESQSDITNQPVTNAGSKSDVQSQKKKFQQVKDNDNQSLSSNSKSSGSSSGLARVLNDDASNTDSHDSKQKTITTVKESESDTVNTVGNIITEQSDKAVGNNTQTQQSDKVKQFTLCNKFFGLGGKITSEAQKQNLLNSKERASILELSDRLNLVLINHGPNSAKIAHLSQPKQLYRSRSTDPTAHTYSSAQMKNLNQNSDQTDHPHFIHLNHHYHAGNISARSQPPHKFVKTPSYSETKSRYLDEKRNKRSASPAPNKQDQLARMRAKWALEKKLELKTDLYSRAMHRLERREFKHSNVRAKRRIDEEKELTFKPSIDHDWRNRYDGHWRKPGIYSPVKNAKGKTEIHHRPLSALLRSGNKRSFSEPRFLNEEHPQISHNVRSKKLESRKFSPNSNAQKEKHNQSRSQQSEQHTISSQQNKKERKSKKEKRKSRHEKESNDLDVSFSQQLRPIKSESNNEINEATRKSSSRKSARDSRNSSQKSPGRDSNIVASDSEDKKVSIRNAKNVGSVQSTQIKVDKEVDIDAEIGSIKKNKKTKEIDKAMIQANSNNNSINVNQQQTSESQPVTSSSNIFGIQKLRYDIPRISVTQKDPSSSLTITPTLALAGASSFSRPSSPHLFYSNSPLCSARKSPGGRSPGPDMSRLLLRTAAANHRIEATVSEASAKSENLAKFETSKRSSVMKLRDHSTPRKIQMQHANIRSDSSDTKYQLSARGVPESNDIYCRGLPRENSRSQLIDKKSNSKLSIHGGQTTQSESDITNTAENLRFEVESTQSNYNIDDLNQSKLNIATDIQRYEDSEIQRSRNASEREKAVADWSRDVLRYETNLHNTIEQVILPNLPFIDLVSATTKTDQNTNLASLHRNLNNKGRLNSSEFADSNDKENLSIHKNSTNINVVSRSSKPPLPPNPLGSTKTANQSVKNSIDTPKRTVGVTVTRSPMSNCNNEKNDNFKSQSADSAVVSPAVTVSSLADLYNILN